MFGRSVHKHCVGVRGQTNVKSKGSASSRHVIKRSVRVGAGVGLALLFAASAAEAETCTTGTLDLHSISSSPAGVSSIISSVVTALLLQSNAFVSRPANSAPSRQGGGVWTRAVGGFVDIKSNTTSTATSPFECSSQIVGCSQQVNEAFAGVQIGTEISRLNIADWNLPPRTTAGCPGTRASVVGGPYAFADNAGNAV
jgi:hypothetical protein